MMTAITTCDNDFDVGCDDDYDYRFWLQVVMMILITSCDDDLDYRHPALSSNPEPLSSDEGIWGRSYDQGNDLSS